jgi:hypothetical protein
MNEKIICAPDISSSIDGVLENLKLDVPLRQALLRANLLLTNLMTLLRPIRIKNRAPEGPKVMYTAEQLGLTLGRIRTLKASVLRGIKEIESGQQWAAKETFTTARDSWNAGGQQPTPETTE